MTYHIIGLWVSYIDDGTHNYTGSFKATYKEVFQRTSLDTTQGDHNSSVDQA